MRYSGFHRAIGIFHRELKHSWQIHFCNEIDAEKIEGMRARYRSLGLNPPSYTAIVIKAAALGIREVSDKFPQINSMLTGFLGWKTIHTFSTISAGVAIARTENPDMDDAIHGVIEHPDQMSLDEISKKLQEYATLPVKDVPYLRNCHYLYNAPRIAQEVMLWFGRTFPKMRRQYRGTFSLTTVGKFGVDYQVTLPQTSCLEFGFGCVRERPIVREGKVVAGRSFFVTLSFDRRLMNGRPCAMLMERVREILEEAEFADVPDAKEKPPPSRNPA